LGHEYAFPPPRLSACCRFSQGTFAQTRGNGRDAPIADLPALTPELGGSTQTGPSLSARISALCEYTALNQDLSSVDQRVVSAAEFAPGEIESEQAKADLALDDRNVPPPVRLPPR
jgi:hypothetical protein